MTITTSSFLLLAIRTRHFRTLGLHALSLHPFLHCSTYHFEVSETVRILHSLLTWQPRTTYRPLFCLKGPKDSQGSNNGNRFTSHKSVPCVRLYALEHASMCRATSLRYRGRLWYVLKCMGSSCGRRLTML